VALDVLVRVDSDGAYANVALPAALAQSGLDERDRAFVTGLVYGVTRRQRALDWAINPFLATPPPPPARAALRLGAYQIIELDTPAYAAVSATVAAAPRSHRGLVNAVLRRVAGAGTPDWPDDATRLSYPDWIVEALTADVGRDAALAALESMNTPARVHRRADGYVQDHSSQLVVEAIDVHAGDLVADVCAAPGGKATALAARGARVVACDSHRGRIGLLEANRAALDAGQMLLMTADARHPPLRPGSFDTVLVDAPCSGLGALKRRPDARWRIELESVARLAALQTELLDAAVGLLRPGGQLVYSVCTMTAAETVQVAARTAEDARLEPMQPPSEPWAAHGDGAMLLPTADHDGMALFRWRRV
jgi:16S rRNA (cytosine967-C5)-methyltransferase